MQRNFPAFPDRGLYVITRDLEEKRDSLIDEVEAAIRGGAAVVQYRAKEGRSSVSEARQLLSVCRRFSVPLIINDDVSLAHAIGADGVHLGREDGALRLAREVLGTQSIIGVSCYDDLSRARQAQEAGATYVAFGRFFPSLTKPNAPCARLETLSRAKGEIDLPIVAIGGITLENGGALLESGAQVLAVIEGVFGAQCPENAAAAFRALWD